MSETEAERRVHEAVDKARAEENEHRRKARASGGLGIVLIHAVVLLAGALPIAQSRGTYPALIDLWPGVAGLLIALAAYIIGVRGSWKYVGLLVVSALATFIWLFVLTPGGTVVPA